MKHHYLPYVKAIIYVNQGVSIALIQRKLKLGYAAVVELLELLEKDALLITYQSIRYINWQHTDWQLFVEQPQLLDTWHEQVVAQSKCKYSLQQNDEGWWYILSESKESQRVVTFVETEELGLCWLAINKLL